MPADWKKLRLRMRNKRLQYPAGDNRRHRGLSGQAFADLASLGRSELSDFENGRREPGAIDFVAKFVDALEGTSEATSIDYLVGRTDVDGPIGQPRQGFDTVEAAQVARCVDQLPEELRAVLLAFVQQLAEQQAAVDNLLSDSLAVIHQLIETNPGIDLTALAAKIDAFAAHNRAVHSDD